MTVRNIASTPLLQSLREEWAQTKNNERMFVVWAECPPLHQIGWSLGHTGGHYQNEGKFWTQPKRYIADRRSVDFVSSRYNKLLRTGLLHQLFKWTRPSLPPSLTLSPSIHSTMHRSIYHTSYSFAQAKQTLSDGSQCCYYCFHM